MAVAYEELDGSPTETFTEQGFEATRKLKCAWADRFALAAEFIGTAYDNGGTATIVPPKAYEHFDKAVCARVGITPFGQIQADNGDVAIAAYPHAIVTLQFSTKANRGGGGGGGADPNNQTLITESIEPTAEFLTLPHESFRWGAADGPALLESEAPGMLMRGLDWVYVLHRMTNVPAATFGLVGKVNSGSVASVTLGYTFAAETLLYNPPSLSRIWTPDGAQAWELTYRFTYKPTGWNKFYRRESGAYESIYLASGGEHKPYTPGDFTALVVSA